MRTVSLIIFALTLPGLCFVRMGNDISEFHRPHPLMLKGEQAMAEATGVSAAGFTLTRAANLQAALEAEELKGVWGLSSIVPSLRRQRENFELAAGFAGNSPDYSRFDPVTIDNIPFPVGSMCIPVDDEIILLSPGGGDFRPQQALTDIFDTLAQETYWLLAASIAVLLCGLTCLGALNLLVPVFMAIVSTLGVLGYLGFPVNFFQLLVFFVVIGLGMDYAIFHRSGNAARTVLASFLTSLVGLGMLGVTSFQVTRSMGITFALGLSFAYFYSRHVVSSK